MRRLLPLSLTHSLTRSLTCAWSARLRASAHYRLTLAALTVCAVCTATLSHQREPHIAAGQVGTTAFRSLHSFSPDARLHRGSQCRPDAKQDAEREQAVRTWLG
jgi:hypothetical protein